MASRPLVQCPSFPLGEGPDAATFVAGFDALRAELEIVEDFSPEALAEAERAEPQPGRPGAEQDLRGLEFVTVDPPSSLDLDQAYTAQTTADGFRVHYAIADPAAFVRPGGALDRETRARGVTMYAPDRSTPLHPRTLSEDHASLLPDRDRPALVWPARSRAAPR